MPSRFGSSENPELPEQVDTSKRYDIYTMEYGQRTVVLRNVIFKGIRALFANNDRLNVMSSFIEVEQANGQAVFISRHSLVRFCEHGTELILESPPA